MDPGRGDVRALQGPRRHHRRGRLVGLALIVAALAGCGESGSTKPESAPFSPLHLDCRGEGRGPTVVFDSGLGVDSSTTWAKVQPAVAKFARACIYDRAGTGQSPPTDPPRTSGRMVAELRKLLDSRGIEPPYVLVGASFGGLNAQLYAANRPTEVAGVVLVDSLHPDLDRRIAPILGARAAKARERALARNTEGVRFADILRSDDQVRRATRFPAVPLVVLEHGISFDPGGKPDPRVERLWTDLQRRLAARSPRGRLVVAERSHHRIAEDQPALVVAAIRSVLDDARRRE